MRTHQALVGSAVKPQRGRAEIVATLSQPGRAEWTLERSAGLDAYRQRGIKHFCLAGEGREPLKLCAVLQEVVHLEEEEQAARAETVVDRDPHVRGGAHGGHLRTRATQGMTSAWKA